VENEQQEYIKMGTKRHPESLEEYPESFRVAIIKISNRIDAGRNALIGIFGQTGNGKSLTAIQFIRGLYLYRNGKEPSNEYLLNHIYFKAKDFMGAMQKVSDELHSKGKVTKGEAHLWDETGVDASSKDALSMKNKILGWLIQTFRNQQQVILFTTPSFFMLDKTIRNLLHYYFEVVTVDEKKKIAVVKPLELQYNVRINKMYYHNLIYPTQEGDIEIEFMGVPKITNELEKMYERKKNLFTKTLNDDIMMHFKRMEMKEKGQDRLTERQKQIIDLIKQGMTSNKEIAKEIGVYDSTISQNIKFIKNKGFDIDSLKKNAKIQQIELKK
jgi:biotin operon repressor